MRRSKSNTSRLRHKLWLQQRIETADGAGGYSSTWQNVAECWVELWPLSGRQFYFAGHVQSEVTHRIFMRFRLDVKAGMRFVQDERVFLIRAVLNSEERNDVMEIAVEERV